MLLPTPTSVVTVGSLMDYHIFTFGDEDSGTHVVTVFNRGEIRDSYVVSGGSYVTLEFVKGLAQHEHPVLSSN